MSYTCWICLPLVVFIKLSSNSPTFCGYFTAISQDKTAKNYLQSLICIKKYNHTPAALGIIWFNFANIHGKEMVLVRLFLETGTIRSTQRYTCWWLCLFPGVQSICSPQTQRVEGTPALQAAPSGLIHQQPGSGCAYPVQSWLQNPQWLPSPAGCSISSISLTHSSHASPQHCPMHSAILG